MSQTGAFTGCQGWIKTTALSSVSGAGAAFNVDAVSGVTGFTIISKTGTDFKSTEPDVGLPADNTARDWTYVEILFKPNGSGTILVYLQLGLVNTGTAGSAWFDDVQLIPTGGGLSSLSASTGYYIYSRINASTGNIEFVNGNPRRHVPE